MSNSQFKLPSISTLAGTSVANFFRTIRGRKVERRYVHVLLITLLIILVSVPFRWYDQLRYYLKIRRYQFKEPPVFILGHWRSGTTFLHNVLCRDPKAGYMTTYLGLFPQGMASKWIFKTFMGAVMPKKRPSDNVKLSPDFPQEDEFALGNLYHYCYYHFFHFPHDYADYYQRYVEFKGKPQVRQRWKKVYDYLIRKALINTGGQRAIFKNPVNTGRIPELLELYPKARFIFIYRNPVVVYLSTKKFFVKLLPTLQFQDISEEEISHLILDVYQRLLQDYEREKALIPQEQLIEIKFEDFEDAPLSHLQSIYQYLGLDNWEEARPDLDRYLQSLQSYQKNRYQITRSELDLVLEQWKFTMEKWSYQVPENLQVIEDKDTRMAGSDQD